MNVSVVVTCLNEEENIRDCLNTLVTQDYSNGQYEVVVADGSSADNTRDIVQEFVEAYPNVRLAMHSRKGTAAGRNTGVQSAAYEYIAFIDADCEAPENWLSTLASAYLEITGRDHSVIAVGGINLPPTGCGSFVKAIGVALDSFIGSFNSIQGRQYKNPLYVSSLSNLNVLYRKQPIIDIGYYDESLYSEAEDADLNFRLHTAGHRFVFIPDSYVWHRMRPTPKTWFKNMFRYGKGRARLLKRYPKMWNLSFVLPLLFGLAIISVIFAPLLGILYLPLLYFPFLVFFSIIQSIKKRQPTIALQIMIVYLIQHFGYAAGEIYGLVNPQVK